MSVGAYDLTTVDAVEKYGGLTASSALDAKIQTLITAVSDRMERECSRKFKARDFTEWYNVNPDQLELCLKNYPLIRLPSITYGEQPCLTVSYSGSSIQATLSASTDRVTLTYYSTTGVRTQTDFLYTTYGSVSALATAIGAVSGFTATVGVNVPSFRICPNSGGDLLQTPAYLLYPYIPLVNPSVDYDIGAVALRFFQTRQWSSESPRGVPTIPSGFQYVLVEYRAGYEDIPDDLAMLCNEIVMDVYNRSLKDWTQKSIKLDQYAHELVDAIKFDSSIRSRLGRYMRIAVGGP